VDGDDDDDDDYDPDDDDDEDDSFDEMDDFSDDDDDTSDDSEEDLTEYDRVDPNDLTDISDDDNDDDDADEVEPGYTSNDTAPTVDENGYESGTGNDEAGIDDNKENHLRTSQARAPTRASTRATRQPVYLGDRVTHMELQDLPLEQLDILRQDLLKSVLEGVNEQVKRILE
jgi:hypothetical protein